jgi:hypothetical protein
MKTAPRWSHLLVLACLALAVRAVYLTAIVRLYGTDQISDCLFMERLARSLAAGQGFTLSGDRIFNQSVGYPALIALFYLIFGSDVRIVLAINVVLGAVSVTLVYLLTWVLLRERPEMGSSEAPPLRPVLTAACLACIYPDSLMYCAFVSAENLLIPLMLLTLLSALWTTGRHWVAGALTGALAAAAASVKAQVAISCLLIPLIWFATGAGSIRRTMAATVAGCMLLAPWAYLNYRDSGGYFVPFCAIAGEVFLDGTNPRAHGTSSNVLTLGPEVEAGHDKIEIDRMKMRTAIGYIKARPTWYLKLLGLKFLRSISPVRDFMFEQDGEYRLFSPFLSRWLPTLFNGLLGLGAIVGCVKLWRYPRERAVAVGLLAGMFGLQLVFFGYSRYRFPYLFCLLPHVSVGLCVVFESMPRFGLVASDLQQHGET